MTFRLGTGQYDGRSKRGGLLVFGPRRTKSPSHPIDSFLDRGRSLSEGFQRIVIKITCADAGKRNFQVFKSTAERLAKEFTFSRMNQWV